MTLPPTRFGPLTFALLSLAAFPPLAVADQPLGTIKVKSVTIELGENGFANLGMTGTAEQLGNCAGSGEIAFVPGADEGTLDGTGVVAFRAANGDTLVGVVAASLDAAGGTLDFVVHWRDAVTFSDGTTVMSTGRFVDHRPPGLLDRSVTPN